MKNKKVIIFIAIIIMTVGCQNKKKLDNITSSEEGKETIEEKEKFIIGHTLNDGRYLTTSYRVPYYNELDSDYYLDEAAYDNNLTILDIIKDLEYVKAINEGDSKLYKYNHEQKKYGDKDFYMLVCNSDKVKDSFIAKKLTSLEGKCSFKIDDIKGVTMFIKKKTLTNKGVTVVITDNSNRDNIYGDDYYLEVYKNNTWQKVKVKENIVINPIGYEIKKGESKEFKINWLNDYGKLKKGKYRLLKSISEVGEGTDHYVSVTFNIK